MPVYRNGAVISENIKDEEYMAATQGHYFHDFHIALHKSTATQVENKYYYLFPSESSRDNNY